MGQYIDWLVMVFVGSLLIIWAYRAFYRWLHQPAATRGLKLGKGGVIPDNDVNVQLLEQAGYEVTSGKHLIPISIELDGEELGRGSRLYIDYIAERDDESYIVKTARDRMPMDWTGSGVRDRLLVYSLLLPECTGVLFVDAKERIIRKITFHIAEAD